MLLSFTPLAFSLAMVPATRASITDLFHRECTMAMRKGEPSYFEGGGAGPLIESDIVAVLCKAARAFTTGFHSSACKRFPDRFAVGGQKFPAPLISCLCHPAQAGALPPLRSLPSSQSSWTVRLTVLLI